MGETSAIQWTDATVNFWWGCTKVGPGCDSCYAETWSKRTGGPSLWGVGAERRKIKSAVALMDKLNRNSSRERPTLVFCQSMSDLFDLEVQPSWFREAWETISECDRLIIQIVTKRVSAVKKRLDGFAWPGHVALLATTCNQDEADRDVPRLLALKEELRIPWVGVSAEPLLGPISFKNITPTDRYEINALTGYDFDQGLPCEQLDWIIVGGESGRGARPMHPQWARSIRDQCIGAKVPYFFKQFGEFGPEGLCGEKWIIRADGSHTAMPTPNGIGHHAPRNGSTFVYRVGKKRAGRLLDGREHNDLPWRRS